jgi:hypothetical protein
MPELLGLSAFGVTEALADARQYCRFAPVRLMGVEQAVVSLAATSIQSRELLILRPSCGHFWLSESLGCTPNP